MIVPKNVNVRKEMRDLIPKRQYLTHGFDRYPAKMIPHLARFVLENFTTPGQSILDPFCGCGTVLIESIVTGRKATGIDVNPLAVLFTKAKTNIYDELILGNTINKVLSVAKSFVSSSNTFPEWITYWFSKTTLDKIFLLKKAISSISCLVEKPYVEAILAIFAKTIRLCSVADPRSPKPFISKKSRLERLNVDFDVYSIFLNLSNQFKTLVASFNYKTNDLKLLPVEVHLMNVLKLTENNIVGPFDAIISSPPYLSAQDYYRSSKLELSLLGLISESELKVLGSKMIGSGRGKLLENELNDLRYYPSEIKKIKNINKRAALVIANYLNSIDLLLSILNKRLRYNGMLCLIIGNSTIRNVYLPIHKWIIQIADMHNFTLKKYFIDRIRDRRVPPKRMRHSSVIKHDHILVFYKK